MSSVLTHGHPDHIGGLVDGGNPVYPNARYVFRAAEYDSGKRTRTCARRAFFNQKLFMKICEPLAPRSTFIKPGDAVASASARSMPSATRPGCWRFISRAEGNQLMITADTFTHYVMAVQRPSGISIWTHERTKPWRRASAMLDRLAADRIFVASCHNAVPRPRLDRQNRRRFRWVPHSLSAQSLGFAPPRIDGDRQQVRCAMASASGPLRRASSEASASSSMVRTRRCGDQTRSGITHLRFAREMHRRRAALHGEIRSNRRHRRELHLVQIGDLADRRRDDRRRRRAAGARFVELVSTSAVLPARRRR